MRLEGIYIREDRKYEVWCRNTDNVLECAGVAKTEIDAIALWQGFVYDNKHMNVNIKPMFYTSHNLEIVQLQSLDQMFEWANDYGDAPEIRFKKID